MPDNTGGTQGAEGATAAAVGGGVLDSALGLLAGIGALAIPGIGPALAAGPLAAALGSAGAGAVAGAGIGAASGGLLRSLVGMRILDEDANLYAEGVRRGGTLVTVQAPDELAEPAADILERYGAVDMERQSADWRKSGWSPFDASAAPYSTQDIDTFRSTRPTPAADTTRNRGIDQREAVLPVVEEELQVGKRQVQRGGVRVHTTVQSAWSRST